MTHEMRSELLTGCCGRTQSGEDTCSVIPSSGICHNLIYKIKQLVNSDITRDLKEKVIPFFA